MFLSWLSSPSASSQWDPPSTTTCNTLHDKELDRVVEWCEMNDFLEPLSRVVIEPEWECCQAVEPIQSFSLFPVTTSMPVDEAHVLTTRNVEFMYGLENVLRTSRPDDTWLHMNAWLYQILVHVQST